MALAVVACAPATVQGATPANDDESKRDGPSRSQSAAPVDVSAGVTALLAAKCPPYVALHSPRRSPAREAAALSGTFYVFNRPVRFTPPVSWAQNGPTGERAARQQWNWIEPLFAPYRYSANPRALARARDLALDWIRANPTSAWDGESADERAPYLAYLLRATACRRLLTRPQATSLLQSAIAHVDFLARQSKGADAVYANASRMLVAAYLSFMPQAPRWWTSAKAGFRSTLARQVNSDDDVAGTQGSPAAHFRLLDLVDKVLRLTGKTTPDVTSIGRGMQAIAPWLVAPNGTLPRFGDGAYQLAPLWAISRSRSRRGLAPLLESGFGIVRQPGSFLAVTDVRGSRHADQLSFELWDRGRRIVADTGGFTGAPEAGAEAFSQSPQAHSVLVVDGGTAPPRDPAGQGSQPPAGPPRDNADENGNGSDLRALADPTAGAAKKKDDDKGNDNNGNNAGDNDKGSDPGADFDIEDALEEALEEEGLTGDVLDGRGGGGGGGGDSGGGRDSDRGGGGGAAGGGLTGSGQGGGWYAIEGGSPTTRRHAVEHRRLFLYRPGQALLVVDRVKSTKPHTYTRQFQFDPRFAAAPAGGAMALRAGAVTVWLYSASGSPEAVRGRRTPPLGWMNGAGLLDPMQPRAAVLLRSRGASGTYVTALGLAGRTTAYALSGSTEQVTRLRVTLPGAAAKTLTVTRAGSRLTVR